MPYSDGSLDAGSFPNVVSSLGAVDEPECNLITGKIPQFIYSHNIVDKAMCRFIFLKTINCISDACSLTLK